MHTNPARNARQRNWRRIHRWAGLTGGWLLALVGLAGALLIIATPLDRWSHPQFFIAATPPAAAPSATLESIRNGLVAAFGERASFGLRLPREAGETLRVNVRSDAWRGTLYLNPATGQEQGRRGETEGFVNLAFKFHSTLFLEERGKAILAGLSALYLLLLISGLLVWWPRQWNSAFRIELHNGLFRALFDAHRVAGAAFGLLLVVAIATGAYMAWRPLAHFVTAIAGEKVVTAPKLPERTVSPHSPQTLDQLVHRAQAEFPDDRVTHIQIPAEKHRPLRIRMRLADDPHPNGRTTLWLAPDDGTVLAVDRWDRVDPGTRALSVVYPLHTGELGGPLLQALVATAGLALGGLGLSGLWLTWQRRR